MSIMFMVYRPTDATENSADKLLADRFNERSEMRIPSDRVSQEAPRGFGGPYFRERQASYSCKMNFTIMEDWPLDRDRITPFLKC